MTIVNTFHSGDSRAVAQEAIDEGPLGPTELDRRAVIAVHNALGEAFASVYGTLVRPPGHHPETRQVMARALQVLDDLGREFRP